MSQKQKWRRDALFMLDPHCYWCRVELIHPAECLQTMQDGQRRLKKFIPTMACLVHLDTKLTYERGESRRPRTVLGCQKCAQENANKAAEALGIDGLRKRSGTNGYRKPKADGPYCMLREIRFKNFITGEPVVQLINSEWLPEETPRVTSPNLGVDGQYLRKNQYHRLSSPKLGDIWPKEKQ